MKHAITLLAALLLAPLATLHAADAPKQHDGSGSGITVASYYFGQYHPNDPRNQKTKGKGWSEWELVKAAKPRFPGHHQPNIPLWGYTDESDPAVMAKKIAAAADHGVNHAAQRGPRHAPGKPHPRRRRRP